MSASFATGDLVFVRPLLDPRLSLDNAIMAVGNATIAWLQAHGVSVATNETAVHVAIAFRNESDADELSFVEATPPAVRVTRASDFFHAWPGATFYRATLRDPKIRRAGPLAARSALSKVGTKYSFDYGPPPTEFYCSSLVRWAYHQATHSPHAHIFIDDDFPLIFVPAPRAHTHCPASNDH